MERARVLEAALDDHPLPVALRPWQGEQKTSKRCLAAHEEVLRDGAGQVEDELPVWSDAAVEGRVLPEEAARDDARREVPGGAAVREELVAAQGPRLGLVVHVVAGSRERRGRGRRARRDREEKGAAHFSPPRRGRPRGRASP